MSNRQTVAIAPPPEVLPPAVLSAIKTGDLKSLKSAKHSTIQHVADNEIAMIASEAALQGQPEILAWCFTKGFPRPSFPFSDNFYASVCGGQSIPIFQLIIDRYKWDLSAHENEVLGDALVGAARDGNVALAKFLLENGMSPNLDRTCNEETAIIWAVARDNSSLEIVKLMLDHGLHRHGTGAAIAAAEVENMEALALLLDNEFDIEEVTAWWGMWPDDESYGYDTRGTALYRACRAGKEQAARYLLGRGANPRAKDQEGTSCLDIARARMHENIVTLLEERLSI